MQRKFQLEEYCSRRSCRVYIVLSCCTNFLQL